VPRLLYQVIEAREANGERLMLTLRNYGAFPPVGVWMAEDAPPYAEARRRPSAARLLLEQRGRPNRRPALALCLELIHGRLDRPSRRALR
jgi:hypothetical protein